MEVSDHAFLGGRLMLREPRRGHRSGTDAVLLAAAAPLRSGQHLIDVGAGAGAAGLAAMCHCGDATATLIEQDPEMAALAAHNVVTNGFGSRVRVIQADLFDARVLRESGCPAGDVVISNPPFYLGASVRASPIAQRAASHVLTGHDHGSWCRRVLALTAPKGQMVIIHRPEALADILNALGGRSGASLRSIHPNIHRDATRVIVTAAKGRRTPFRILRPLFLHDETGAFASEAETLHRGEGTLA